MKQAERRSRFMLGLCYASALLSALVFLVLALAAERQSRDAFLQTERVEAQDRLNLLRSDLRRAIDANVQLANAVVTVIGFEPGIDQARFSKLGERLLGAGTQICGISAAPGLVVGLVHPFENNRGALGFDYRAAEPLAWPEGDGDADALMTLRGPVRLMNGVEGFVAQAPVYAGVDDPDRFWGLVSLEIDAEKLYRAGGLRAPDLGLDVALGTQDTADAVFFGDAAVLGAEPVRAELVAPGAVWRLAATPSGGWGAAPAPWGLRGLFALAGLLIVGPILGTARFIASGHAKLATIRDREAELSRLSWRLEFALAASEVGVWDVDLETDALLWDARARALFGFPDRPGPFGEADWAGVLHPEDRDRALAQASEAISGNGRFVSEYRIVRPGGEVRQIRDMASVFHGDDGRARLVGLVWDITADVERQEELNLRRLEAEAATDAKSRFLATMSHEIRTPMSGVLALLRMIMDEPLSPRQREQAEIALASARNLLDILNDILDFSKLEAQRTQVRVQPVPLREMMREVVDLMAAGAALKGLTLRLEVAQDAPEAVAVDPLLLRQVLTNLLSNATKFTPSGGNIAVSVGHTPDPEGDRLSIEVADTGIGIDPAACERIFEDFVQADDGLARATGGTGLGLAISRRLVELMGGRIGIYSRPGAGSAFSFWVRAPAVATPVLRSEEAAVVAPPAAARRPLRILVAEDNATNRYVIDALLRRDGHSIVMVESGFEAIEAVKAEAFDVVLMDVQMPRLDGLSATRAIRALSGEASAVPIIALTANAVSGDRETCLAAGMDAYLSKPVEPDALRASLDRVCRAGAAERTIATG